MNDLTALLQRIENGDHQAFDELLPVVYQELRQLASRQMAHESPGNTLQTTALVHECYLRLVGDAHSFENRAHFFAAAAESMRRILVERARSRHAIKRGGTLNRCELTSNIPSNGPEPDEILQIDEFLDQLADQHPQVAELVKLHYFGGFNLSEAGRLLGISSSTAHRHWVFAKAWLYDALN
ncbi:MAG: sigma-70 family RNA polymerase sigma factor [Pirellulaceae bacterium]